MTSSLYAHTRGYHISREDCLVSLVTGLSGLPYAIRHWQLSNRDVQRGAWRHRTLAVLEAVPFSGLAIGLFERTLNHVRQDPRHGTLQSFLADRASCVARTVVVLKLEIMNMVNASIENANRYAEESFTAEITWPSWQA